MGDVATDGLKRERYNSTLPARSHFTCEDPPRPKGSGRKGIPPTGELERGAVLKSDKTKLESRNCKERQTALNNYVVSVLQDIAIYKHIHTQHQTPRDIILI